MMTTKNVRSSEKMRGNSNKLNPEQFVLLLAEPIMDLFYVSGYSLLYSELHQNLALFEPCKVAWQNFMKSTQDDFLELLATIIK
jgi:hypothetical protein